LDDPRVFPVTQLADRTSGEAGSLFRVEIHIALPSVG
jgi:hypothetical protein